MKRYNVVLLTNSHKERHNTSKGLFKESHKNFLLCRQNHRDKQLNSRASCTGFKLAAFDAGAVWTLGSRHLHAGVICHFALIVSLRPGCNVSIKIMSIEKSFLVFTFKLQHAFTGSAVFHVKWSVLMQTRSLGIQRGSTLVTEGLWWVGGGVVRKKNEDGRGMDERGGRGALIERLWLAVFSGTPGPPSCSNRGCRVWRCSQGEVNAAESSLHPALPSSSSFHPSVSLTTRPHFPCPSKKKSIWLCKVQLGPRGSAG